MNLNSFIQPVFAFRQTFLNKSGEKCSSSFPLLAYQLSSMVDTWSFFRSVKPNLEVSSPHFQYQWFGVSLVRFRVLADACSVHDAGGFCCIVWAMHLWRPGLALWCGTTQHSKLPDAVFHWSVRFSHFPRVILGKSASVGCRPFGAIPEAV